MYYWSLPTTVFHQTKNYANVICYKDRILTGQDSHWSPYHYLSSSVTLLPQEFLFYIHIPTAQHEKIKLVLLKIVQTRFWIHTSNNIHHTARTMQFPPNRFPNPNSESVPDGSADIRKVLFEVRNLRTSRYLIIPFTRKNVAYPIENSCFKFTPTDLS